MATYTQTPTKRISTTIPDAPKSKMQKSNWMDSSHCCEIIGMYRYFQRQQSQIDEIVIKELTRLIHELMSVKDIDLSEIILKLQKLCCVVPDSSKTRLLLKGNTFTDEEEMKIHHKIRSSQKTIDEIVVKELAGIIDLLRKIKDRDLSETISNIQELCKLFPENVN